MIQRMLLCLQPYKDFFFLQKWKYYFRSLIIVAHNVFEILSYDD